MKIFTAVLCCLVCCLHSCAGKRDNLVLNHRIEVRGFQQMTTPTVIYELLKQGGVTYSNEGPILVVNTILIRESGEMQMSFMLTEPQFTSAVTKPCTPISASECAENLMQQAVAQFLSTAPNTPHK